MDDSESLDWPRRTSVEPPPAVSRRMEFTTIAEFVAFEMQRIPGWQLNLAEPADRERLATVLLHFLEGYVSVLTWDVSKAADRGIRQMFELSRDPTYYEDRVRRAARARATSQRQADEARQVYLQERAAEELERERLIAEGKLRPLGPRRLPDGPVP